MENGGLGGGRKRTSTPKMTYPVAIGVVECLEFDDVGMAHDPHDLQLTVLQKVSAGLRGSCR